MNWNIHVGDVLAWAARYDGPPFHAALFDPPYHLTNITKRFGGNGSAPAKFGKDGAFQRASAGFMGQQWDGGDLIFRPETWAAFLPLLHPGAFVMAFASTRGHHRMACAAEDAGYIVHPFIGWVFGSGFPKATRVRDNGQQVPEWEGHRYGLQAMKPSLEPIYVFQVPYEGRPVDSITATGAGALNVEAGRVPANGDVIRSSHNVTIGGNGVYQGGWAYVTGDPNGKRWPPNLALSHSPGCTPLEGGGWRCADGCAVQAMGAQSGESVSTGGLTPGVGAGDGRVYAIPGDRLGTNAGGLGDSGTAARFFPNSDYLLDRLEASDPFLYTAKAPSWEREAGLDDAVLTTVNDGRQTPIDNPYQRGETKRRNQHPTVKPITLTHWLASLLLPPAEYAPRRLMIPFSGASSEMIGAGLAGWDVVQGIEQSSEYAAIGWARLEWWARYWGWNIDAAMTAARDRFSAPAVPQDQLALPMFAEAAR